MKAEIRIEQVVLKTYPYSDPSPTPEFGRIYPYNRYDGYTSTGADQTWDMVVLENPYIKLWINPAAGGKVWGAIEKASGREFIYFNHSAKFRDVAMRGPWTSGGIEFNVGILGHSLSCSSPVDYHTRTNADDSVSCFIGATDWPSRTRWYVEITLPPDTAWFRTRTSWYNNSGLDQACYSWSNAGIKTAGDLSYIFPGHSFLGHDGQVHPWPIDAAGHDLSKYEQNDHGHYKSYHVFGSISDFWGCYWQQDQFGIGHYAPYDEKPGRKIWIWGLSRYGMLWEDLLTDKDGQYTEVQSGRLFNQSISASSSTPFKHKSFLPGSFDRWDEYWMPVRGTSGLQYSCPELSFYINADSELEICAHQPLKQTLRVTDKTGELAMIELHLSAMNNRSIRLSPIPDPKTFRVWLGDTLLYDAEEEQYDLKRPAVIAPGYQYDSAEGLYLQGKEWERQRFFAWAIEKYQLCLQKDPNHTKALVGLAAIRLRFSDYQESLECVMRALSIDTYDGEANYLYGLVNLRLGNTFDAKDGFSIAAQSLAYRSVAQTELAKTAVRARQYTQALTHLDESLACNTANPQAHQLRVFIHRRKGDRTRAAQLAADRLQQDPLDHVLRFESCLPDPEPNTQGANTRGANTRGANTRGVNTPEANTPGTNDLNAGITSEWPHETFLEIAAFYSDIHAYPEALEALQLAPSHPMVELWKAYLSNKTGDPNNAQQALHQALTMPPAQVFPHRREDMTVLQWAMTQSASPAFQDPSTSWKLKYYSALYLLQSLKTEQALQLLVSCGNEPDYYPFYTVRAMARTRSNEDPESDLQQAVSIAPDAWRPILQLSKHYAEQEQWARALGAAANGYARNPSNYYLGLQLAKCLMYNEQFEAGISLIGQLQVLPNEGASEGRNVWRETNLHAAVNAIIEKKYAIAESYIGAARTWPENIGVGRPYDVDERLEDYLLYLCARRQANGDAEPIKERIAGFRQKHPDLPKGSSDLFVYLLAGTPHTTDGNRAGSPSGNQAPSTAASQGVTTGSPSASGGNSASPAPENAIAAGIAASDRNKWLDPNSTKLPIRWSLALLGGDTQTLDKLTREPYILPPALPYEIIFEDREFTLIKKLYTTGLLIVNN